MKVKYVWAAVPLKRGTRVLRNSHRRENRPRKPRPIRVSDRYCELIDGRCASTPNSPRYRACPNPQMYRLRYSAQMQNCDHRRSPWVAAQRSRFHLRCTGIRTRPSGVNVRPVHRFCHSGNIPCIASVTDSLDDGCLWANIPAIMGAGDGLEPPTFSV